MLRLRTALMGSVEDALGQGEQAVHARQGHMRGLARSGHIMRLACGLLLRWSRPDRRATRP